MSFMHNFYLQDRYLRQLSKLQKKHKPAFTQEPKSNHCLKCNYCCWQRPGSMSKADVSLIAKFLKISKFEFFNKYCIVDEINSKLCLVPIRKNQTSLAGKFLPSEHTFDIDDPCIFLDEAGCKIHSVKPEACRKMQCWIESDYDEVISIPEEFVSQELGWDGDRYWHEHDSDEEE